MRRLVVALIILVTSSSCAEEISIEQRVRSCDRTLLSDQKALLYRDKDNHNILMMASEVGCFSLVASLVDKIDINERTRIGTTALFSAVESADSRIVRLLIQKNIDVNATEFLNGEEALIVAVMMGNIKITRILLESGANPNRIETKLNSTSLHMAVSAKRYSLVKLLLEYGADSTIKAKRLGTPLDIAKRKKDERMIKLLTSKS